MQKVLLPTAFAVACFLAASVYSEETRSSAKEVDDDAQDEIVMLQTTQHVLRLGEVQSDQPQKKAKSDGLASPRALLNTRKSFEPGDIDNTNICFIKIAKTGSSTGAGVTRRIASQHKLNGVHTSDWISDIGEPGVYTEHRALRNDLFGPNPTKEPIHPDFDYLGMVLDLKLPVFLWSIIRDPSDRALSQYYMKAASNGWSETPEDKLNWFSQYTGDEQFRYLRGSANDTIEDALSLYGVVGVLERFDESMVVLAATLRVPVTDVLLMSAKNTSQGFTYYNPANNGGTLEYHPPHGSLRDEPVAVQDLMQRQFQADDKLDQRLHKVASKILDEKIASMHLQPAIESFKQLLAEVTEDCGYDSDEESNMVAAGRCYMGDEGCNYRCLDKYNDRGREMCEWCD
mmetsp:Transcript_154610/g.281016  ORF Transcript_154610/g.281016 Transcript_154610/m.281016 type:complete len:401 (+) Transcript_154610:72-1274(+)